MNYAQCHMNATARDFNSEIQQADTNGLDALFDAEVLPGTTSDYQVVPTIGVSVQEAAKVLGLSVKTVKDRLRKGTLAGFKKKDKFGDAWLVSLEQSGLVGTTRDYQVGPTEDSGLVGTTRDYQVGPTDFPKEPPDLTLLVELLKQKDHEIEAASFRIGYLEAQLESERQQVKLLTDSQHKANWWSQFCSWFLGRT